MCQFILKTFGPSQRTSQITYNIKLTSLLHFWIYVADGTKLSDKCHLKQKPQYIFYINEKIHEKIHCNFSSDMKS